MRDKLIAIQDTLNNVEVSGQRNLYLLLGALQELTILINTAEKEEEKEEVTKDG